MAFRRKTEDSAVKKMSKTVAINAEEVETVTQPVAQVIVADVEEPQPAMTGASRRSSKERERAEEDYIASRNLRQDDAIIAGRYITAARRNNVLSGMISGVEVRNGHAFWAIYDGPVVVLIPFQDALPRITDSSFSSDEDALVRQRQMMSKSVGATIPFSVENVVPDGDVYLVYGSRKNALERIRKRYFGEGAPNPVKVGDIVRGVFLGVGPHAAWLCVNGVDVRMIARQLSHRYMDDMMQHFKAGDEVDLQVQNIEEDNDELTLILSALPCELKVCQRRYDRIRQGSRYVATITSHRVVNALNRKTNKRELYYVSSMWLEGVNVPAYATVTSSHAQGHSYSGERVMVEVEDIADNGYVRCRIISYLP